MHVSYNITIVFEKYVKLIVKDNSKSNKNWDYVKKVDDIRW